MTAVPTIRYARTRDGADIAYWKIGRGPALVHTPNVQLSHLRVEWEVEGLVRWYAALERGCTLVRYDHRGSGLSSRDRDDQTIDALVADIDAVADAAGLERFALLGWTTGGLPAIAYASRRSERVSHLVLWSSFVRDATHGAAPRMRSLFEMAARDWEMFTESIAQAALGWSDAHHARQWAAVERAATTQAEFLRFVEVRREWNVAEELASVLAPTLVLHDTNNALASEAHSREIAAAIPDAQLRAGSGEGGAPDEASVRLIREFLGVAVEGGRPLAGLTERETEVLAEVATGASNAEIARRLSISVNTVMRHLTHVYAKTGVSGRAEAVRYALDHGVGQPF